MGYQGIWGLQDDYGGFPYCFCAVVRVSWVVLVVYGWILRCCYAVLGGLLDGYGWLPVCCYAVIGYQGVPVIAMLLLRGYRWFPGSCYAFMTARIFWGLLGGYGWLPGCCYTVVRVLWVVARWSCVVSWWLWRLLLCCCQAFFLNARLHLHVHFHCHVALEFAFLYFTEFTNIDRIKNAFCYFLHQFKGC